MSYSTIDGDISDFFDWMSEVSDEFETEELQTFLLNEGHALEEIVSAIVVWQEDRFEPVGDEWRRLRLTEAGRAAVRELQSHSPKLISPDVPAWRSR